MLRSADRGDIRACTQLLVPRVAACTQLLWARGRRTAPVRVCWDGGDEAGRRLAAVQLAELKAATQQQIADAFGIGIVTLWRLLDGYRRGGLAGLVPGKRGPKGPSKLTQELTQTIGELAAAGKSQAAIAAATGVSTFAVRAALGRVPSLRPAPGAPAAADGTAGGNAAGVCAVAGGEAAWEQDELPVLPDPVPRDGERALARFGLLGEGAAPVFTAGARLPAGRADARAARPGRHRAAGNGRAARTGG